MTGEELSGPPGPKVTRLLAFAGAGVVCVLVANKWSAWESKWMQQKNQPLPEDLPPSSVRDVLK